MVLSPAKSRITELRAQIKDTKRQLRNLDKGNDVEGVQKMALQGFLTSLEVQYESEQRTEDQEQHERDMKFLDDTEPNSLTTTEPSRPQSRYYIDEHAIESAASSHNILEPVLASANQPSWNFGSLQDPVPTLDTSAMPSVDDRSASGSNSSPDAGFLRPEKRQRESLELSMDQIGHTAKSMRTTPSPAVTGVTTPTSLDSLELPADPDLFALFGGNPKDQLRELREARAEEKLLEARRKQEREDEEFARSLMAQGNDYVLSEDNWGAGPSTAPRSTYQTTLDDQGLLSHAYQLSSSPLPIRADPFSMPSLPIKRENSYQNTGNYLPVEIQGSYQPQSSQFPCDSTEYINLCSDDEYEQSYTFPEYSSSDVVEIDARAFNSNSHVNQMQGITPNTYSIYGDGGDNSNVASWGYSGGQFGSHIVNATRSMYNSAIDLVNNQIASYGNTPIGFGSSTVYDNSGVGTSHNSIGLNGFDETPQNLAPSVFGRHGIDAHDPANRALVDQYYSRVDYVTNDPTRTAAEIKTLLENIRPDEELPPENREGTPDAMKYGLMEHQKLGLSWMKSMEEGSNKGGILGKIYTIYSH